MENMKTKMHHCGRMVVMHGRTKTKEYFAWRSMITRCRKYPTYLAKSIQVCEEWKLDFMKFLSDMGEAPTKLHTLDRIENNGHYCKENCRWATTKVQNRNYSQNVVIEFDGISMTVTEWAEKLKLNRHLVYDRLERGWSVERSLTTPLVMVKGRRKRKRGNLPATS